MRAPTILVLTLALVTPVLSGCLAGDDLDQQNLPGTGEVPFDLAEVEAPGAELVVREDGLHLLWTGDLVDAPTYTFTIPEEVTRVDAVVRTKDPGLDVLTVMYHEDTGRIRCWPDLYGSYFEFREGTSYCSGLTVLDPRPATWEVIARGAIPASGEAPFELDLHLSTEPLDGSAGALNLSALAMPRFDQLPTEVTTLEASSDGAPLHVEVTLPDAEGPFPAILISSPYNTASRSAGYRAQNASINNWVSRGYAVVVADVRGFGRSGGCVEVWGPNEQQDQVDLVAWVGDQPWSDGKIGFYGQSYVGTTPHAAAVHQAPGLTTIATVAGLTDAYFDWHWGGVPNGESIGSPVSYQQLGTRTSVTPWEDPTTSLLRTTDGLCDPTLIARANDPRALHDSFYDARNFSALAGDIEVPVWYAHGFYDENVKPSQILNFFDAIETPKKGLFGPWVHEHPVRGDQELLLHAWLDHWLMGRDTGIMATPTVEVVTNAGTLRTGETWPPEDARKLDLPLDLEDGTLGGEPDGNVTWWATYVASPWRPSDEVEGAPTEGMETLIFEGEPLAERLYVSGRASLGFTASLQGMENTYFAAWLHDVAPDGSRELLTYGMLNAALRNGYETYDPVPPGDEVRYRLPFQPTEHVVEPGHRLVLEVTSTDVDDWYIAGPTEPGLVTLYTGGDTGSALRLPVLDDPGDVPVPASVQAYVEGGA